MMQAVQITAPGGVENLYVGEVSIPSLREREVLIKVHYTALNRADLLQRKGRYPPPPGESSIMGLEAAGTIEQMHDSCIQGWKVGDRVMALLPGGGYAEYVAAYEEHIIPVPHSMSLQHAAAIPEAWLTAFQLLYFVGGFTPSDSVLVHAGASGVGTALIQLIKLFGTEGARAYVTAGSQEKIDFTKSLGAIEGFNYKEDHQLIIDKLTQLENGRGIDLILDPVGGSMWQLNSELAAIDGRWVVYANMGGGEIHGNLLEKVLRKRISMRGTGLRNRSKEYKSKLISTFTQQVLPQFEQGKLKPIVDRELTLDEIADAHRCMEENRNTGKIIVKVIREKHSDEL